MFGWRVPSNLTYIPPRTAPPPLSVCQCRLPPTLCLTSRYLQTLVLVCTAPQSTTAAYVPSIRFPFLPSPSLPCLPTCPPALPHLGERYFPPSPRLVRQHRYRRIRYTIHTLPSQQNGYAVPYGGNLIAPRGHCNATSSSITTSRTLPTATAPEKHPKLAFPLTSHAPIVTATWPCSPSHLASFETSAQHHYAPQPSCTAVHPTCQNLPDYTRATNSRSHARLRILATTLDDLVNPRPATYSAWLSRRQTTRRWRAHDDTLAAVGVMGIGTLGSRCRFCYNHGSSRSERA